MLEQESIQNQAQIAVPKKRVAAFVIDDLVVSLLFMIIFWSQISSLRTIEEINLFLAENFSIIILIKVLYQTYFIWQSGMTLGKYAMKIKVVLLKTGVTPPLHIALARASLRIVSETFFYLGFVMAFFNPLVQTFHDKLTGCVVIDA